MQSSSFENGYSIISKLPVEINMKIKEYFVSQETCDKLLLWWEDNYILSCSAKEVEYLAIQILKDKEAIEYLCRKNEYVKSIYKEHFIEKKKYYHLMTPTCSFITAVLMYMWH